MKKTAMIMILGLVAMLFLPSCEKEVVNYMELYYEESVVLPGHSTDSVTRFSDKVEAYVTVNPDERESHYYPLIQENIEKAKNYVQLDIIITVEDWKDLTEIKFAPKKR